MKNNKTITITTKLFKLQIFWNGVVMGIQLGLLFGVLALCLFAQTEAVRKLCVVALLVDLAVIIFLIVTTASVSIEDSDTEQSSSGTDKFDVTVDRKSNKPKVEEKKTGNSKSKTINNKVPVPNPQQQSTPQSPVENKSTSSSPSTDNPTMKPVEEMTEQDWEDLFKME